MPNRILPPDPDADSGPPARRTSNETDVSRQVQAVRSRASPASSGRPGGRWPRLWCRPECARRRREGGGTKEVTEPGRGDYGPAGLCVCGLLLASVFLARVPLLSEEILLTTALALRLLAARAARGPGGLGVDGTRTRARRPRLFLTALAGLLALVVHTTHGGLSSVCARAWFLLPLHADTLRVGSHHFSGRCVAEG